MRVYLLTITIFIWGTAKAFISKTDAPLTVSIVGPTVLCPVGTATYNATLSGTNTCGTSLKYNWTIYPLPSRIAILAGGGVNDNFITLKVIDSSTPVTNMSVILSISCGTTTLTSNSLQNISVTDLKPPIVADVNRCGPGTVTLTATPNGQVIRWYDAITNGNLLASNGGSLGTPTVYTTPSGTPGNTFTYYVSSFDPYHSCESTTRASISAIVNAIPSTPTGVTGNGRFDVGNLTITAIGALPSGGKFNWYNTSNQLLSSGPTFTTVSPITISQNNLFSVKAASTFCESSPFSINVIIEPLPIILASNDKVVKGANVTLSTSTQYASYIWKNAIGGTVSTNPTYITNSPGRYTLTVTKSGITGNGMSLPFDLKTQFDGLNKNYVIVNTLLTKTSADPTNSPVDTYSETVKYYDGLGRPTQSIATQGSPSKKDVVQPITYDGFNRERIKYLPYSASENNGWFKEDALKNPSVTSGTDLDKYRTGKQYQFYQTGGLLAIDQFPYLETRFEPSPLNRVVKSGAPGQVWQPDNTDSYASIDRTVKKDYQLNGTSEVIQFDYVSPNPTYPSGLVKIGRTTFYQANQLTKDYSKDEQGNEVIEFSNKEGQVVLKKVQSDAITYAQTYYIYDDRHNLVCVLPPEATKSILANLPITWANKVGVTVGSNNGLTTTVSAYGSAGATSTVSTETLAAGTDGWVETTANEVNTSRMIGLANTNVNAGTTIQYALELRNDGKIYVWENGTAGAALGSYISGTVIRVSREGTAIKYYVDGIYKQTSGTTSTGTLMADVALGSNGATLKDVVISFKVNTSLPSILNNLAFQYVYDSRMRMIQKQVPGADPVYMVYDNRDRLVLTQDGNQRKDASSNPLTNWLFTKYDVLNRPVLMGIYTADSILTQSKMQDRVNRFYNAVPANGGAWFETYTGLTTTHGYDNKSFPSITNSDQYLIATYYDNYSFKSLYGSTEYDFKSTELPLDVVNGYPGQITTSFAGTLGLVTGTKVKMLSGNTWLKSVNYYDDHYRVVQNITDNIKGYTATTNIYDFVGKVLRTKSSLFLGQPVTWTNLTGVQLQGDVLSSTGTGSWGDVTTSSQVLPANTDGWFEITFGNNTPYLEIGLVDVYSGSSYTNIDYGWFIQGLLTYAKENGTTVWSTGSTSPGDVFRIERVNGIIYYKRNGIVYYKSSVPSTTSLLAQVSFFTAGAKVSQGRLSNTFTGGTAPVAASYFVKRYDYDHAGRLLKTWHQIKDNSNEVLLTYNVYNELGQLIDKKLYNTDLPSVADNSRSFKQSVDYRYNIRGWLTSINNSTLSLEATTNDDTGDLFGMNLSYEQSDASLGNTGLYNGNISGIRWSNYLGTAPVKENGYKFGYDAMNRLTAANSRANKAGTWQTGDYSENGLAYDLNGNIQSLSRRSDGKIVIDSLGYNYGSGTSLSNKLLSVTDKVTDATNKAKGFSDGNTAGNDYTYDWNGNLLTDKNKGITLPITYNHLNLPTTVVRSYSNANYLYDATGNKHGQVATYGTTQKFTDYVGPWIFENNELQFLQHDEGRIMLTSQQKVYTSSCDVVNTDFVSTANVTLAATTINGEKYIQVTPTVGINMNKLGISQIGNVISVAEGERYVFRVKGYNGAAANANLYVKGNTADVLWPGACLPYTAVNESWVEESFTIPTGVTQITLGVLFNSTALATASNVFYINEIEFYKKTSLTSEYQYNLKDHLGNVRVTFTTKTVTQQIKATFESDKQATEANDFLHYPSGGGLINTQATNAHAGTNSEYLNGGYNGQVGVAKSFAVMPGDQLQIEAYAKYNAPSTTSSNLTGFATALLGAFNLSAPVINEVGTASSAINNWGALEAGGYGDGSTDQSDPRVFVTIITFDKNYNYLDVAYQQLTSSGYMSSSYTVRQPGYAYMYVSNEHPKLIDVYVDDVTMTYTPSAIIANNDYYPFGLQLNSYSRENSVQNKYLFNGGSELQTDLNLGWYSTLFRTYDPAIGRFIQIDPLTDFFSGITPYNFAENNPVLYGDPSGLSPNFWQRIKAFFGIGRLSGTRAAGNQEYVKPVARSTGKPMPYYFPLPPSLPTPKAKSTPEPTQDVVEEEPEEEKEPAVVYIVPAPILKPATKPRPKPRPKTQPKPQPADPDPTPFGEIGTSGLTFNAYQFEFKRARAYHTPSNDKLINDLAKLLKSSHAIHLTVQGNVSAVPADSGTERDYQNALMQGRANVIYNALIRAGVSASQLKASTGTAGVVDANMSATFTLTKH